MDQKTYLIGNGINKFLSNDALSWDNLLITLWNKYSKNKIHQIPKGVTNSEIMELLFLQASSSDIKKEICKTFNNLVNTNINIEKENQIIKFLKNKNIITTNYDHNLGRILNLVFQVNKTKDFTDYYPWTSYLNSQDPQNKTKIWFIHGTKKYSRSIRIGFTDYNNAISHAKKMFSNANKNNRSETDYSWYYEKSLFKHFLEDDLEIYGLKLALDELFLRWLIFKKARNYPETKITYHCVNQQDELDSEFFINGLNSKNKIKIYKNYDVMYQ